MRLQTLRIQNFRSFKDETIRFDPYTCLVGPNGAGKSNVLRALCVFFRDRSGLNGSPDTLSKEDFHKGNTTDPIRITLTFGDLSPDAKTDLAAYVRQDKLVVSAVATWSDEEETATVQQHGSRMGNPDFSVFFAKEEDESAAQLKTTYASIRTKYPDLPEPGHVKKMHDALRKYEDEHPADLRELPSHDQFYGFTKGTSLLDKHLQFIYVPAVKDATDEQQEEKDSIIGRLLARAVRTQVSFKAEIASLTEESRKKYDALLANKNPELTALSKTLTDRIREWATPDATLSLEWAADGTKPVEVADPVARVIAGQGGFTGDLARMGHGMQRSFLLAILQVLASSGDASAPTLLLACEEPELYQHPPQIRHLASVLRKLSNGNAHVVLSTHSPLFVTGREFESVRLVRRESIGGPTKVRHATLQAVSDAIKAARGGKTFDDPARLAKLHESLHPGLSEMFFAERLVLVEGHSDQAYLSSCLELQGRWEEFRRLGIHVVPAGNKSHLIQPRAVASLLGIPTFTIFDADSNSKVENGHRAQHDLDNCTLLRLCGETEMPLHPWPTRQTANLVMWTTNIEDAVKSSTDGTAYSNAAQAAHKHFGYVEGSLVKDAVFIAKVIETLFESGHKPGALADLADRVIAFFKV